MKKLLPLFLALLMLLTACSKAADPGVSPEPPVKTSDSPEESPTPTPTPTPNYHPLTGEVIDAPFANTRPYAVMINNIGVALPHCGISGADIIYEILAEGNITRMMAIFSDINKANGPIGSMRSSRPYYIETALSYDAIYVHAGGSEQAYSDIASKGVNNIDGVRGNYDASSAFYRDKNRQQYGYEHSLFTTNENILKATEKLGYSTEHKTASFDYGLRFTDEPAMTGASAANTVNVSFEGVKTTDLTYHADTGKYTAVQYKKELVDGNTNQSLTFKNILVLYAETKTIDDYGRKSVNLDTTGTGLFICNGKSIAINWKHGGTGSQFSYTTADGQPLELARGTSYIAIVPTGSTIGLA